MKRLLWLIVCFAVLVAAVCQAQTRVQVRCLDFGVNPVAGRTVTATPTVPWASDGTNIYAAFAVQTNLNSAGNVVLPLLSASYDITLSGIQESWRINVPVSSNLLNAAALTTNVLALTNWPFLLANQTNIQSGAATAGLVLSADGSGSSYWAPAGAGSQTPLVANVNAALNSITNASTIQATNFAGNGAALTNTSGMVPAALYGVQANGQDMTANLQAALTAAAGRTLTLGDLGTITVASQVTVPANTRITGAQLAGQTVINYTGSGVCMVAQNNDVIDHITFTTPQGATNNTVAGTTAIYLNSANANNRIQMESVFFTMGFDVNVNADVLGDNLAFRSCTFRGRIFGVACTNSSLGNNNWVGQVLFDSCQLWGSTNGAKIIPAGRSHCVSFINCDIADCATALVVSNCDNVIVQGCDFERNGSGSMLLQNLNGASIQSSSFIDTVPQITLQSAGAVHFSGVSFGNFGAVNQSNAVYDAASWGTFTSCRGTGLPASGTFGIGALQEGLTVGQLGTYRDFYNSVVFHGSTLVSNLTAQTITPLGDILLPPMLSTTTVAGKTYLPVYVPPRYPTELYGNLSDGSGSGWGNGYGFQATSSGSCTAIVMQVFAPQAYPGETAALKVFETTANQLTGNFWTNTSLSSTSLVLQIESVNGVLGGDNVITQQVPTFSVVSNRYYWVIPASAVSNQQHVLIGRFDNDANNTNGQGRLVRPYLSDVNGTLAGGGAASYAGAGSAGVMLFGYQPVTQQTLAAGLAYIQGTLTNLQSTNIYSPLIAGAPSITQTNRAIFRDPTNYADVYGNLTSGGASGYGCGWSFLATNTGIANQIVYTACAGYGTTGAPVTMKVFAGSSPYIYGTNFYTATALYTNAFVLPPAGLNGILNGSSTYTQAVSFPWNSGTYYHILLASSITQLQAIAVSRFSNDTNGTNGFRLDRPYVVDGTGIMSGAGPGTYASSSGEIILSGYQTNAAQTTWSQINFAVTNPPNVTASGNATATTNANGTVNIAVSGLVTNNIYTPTSSWTFSSTSTNILGDMSLSTPLLVTATSFCVSNLFSVSNNFVAQVSLSVSNSSGSQITGYCGFHCTFINTTNTFLPISAGREAKMYFETRGLSNTNVAFGIPTFTQ